MEQAIGLNLNQLSRLHWALGQNAVCEASLNMLKDYMQTGKFNRGDQEFSAQCSIVLGGDIDTDIALREPDGRHRHLFEPLPPELQDAPFWTASMPISPAGKCQRSVQITTRPATVS